MQIVPLSSIEVRKRQRKEIPATHVKSLRESILHVGLLHPPVCWRDGETWVLSAGECRFRTIEALAAEKLEFHHGNNKIPVGYIPITELREGIELLAFEAELDENVRRLDLTWQDKAQAYADLHTMRLKSNPQQTLADTKAELVELNAPSLHTGAPMRSANSNASEIREAITIAEHLGDEEVSKARNAREALSHILRKEEQRIQAALIKRVHAQKAPETLTLYHDDMTTRLPLLESNSVDLVIADPPYGIKASQGGFSDRTVIHHHYEDTPEVARKLIQTILTECFRITKPRANIFIFCDIDNFQYLKTVAANMGWVPFRRPMIWQKSESEGMAPWGGAGPRITTEFIFFATKGERGMTVSPTDVLNVRRVSRNLRIHGAEKPVDLLKRLIEVCTLPGDTVLDPCCGSGSTLVACRELKRTGIGIEKDKDYHTAAFTNVHSEDLKEAPVEGIASTHDAINDTYVVPASASHGPR